MKRLALLLAAVAVLIPLGVAGAWAADEPPEIPLVIDKHRFTPEEIRVKAGAPFVLVITNKDSGPEEFESRDLKIEKIIPGGKTVKLKMPALKKGTYPFIGEYHEKTAMGQIVAE